MTQDEENQYLTCVSDGVFYKKLCSNYDSGFTVLDFEKWVRECLSKNLSYTGRVAVVVLKEIADYYTEEMPKYSKMFNKSKVPEFITEAKASIQHKTALEEFLKNARQINLNIDKLINNGKLNMKYSKGFHTPTVYNNIDVEDLTKEDIMEAIRKEKADIAAIQDLKESKVIQKEIAEHESNISRLLVLLDKSCKTTERNKS